jgi:hypothetical protein
MITLIFRALKRLPIGVLIAANLWALGALALALNALGIAPDVTDMLAWAFSVMAGVFIIGWCVGVIIGKVTIERD